jgi:low affinity Fe/Cu permease
LNLSRGVTRMADSIAQVTGRPVVLMVSLLVVAISAISGPVYQFSNSWQLAINTITSRVTFLMVFPIQSTQNRGAIAVQAKLDKRIRALEPAKKEFMALKS